MAKVEVLAGMISSGKSTYAAQRAEDGAIVINGDAIVLAVHGGDYSLYDDSIKSLYKTVGLAIFSHAAALGRDVVVDQTCLTRKTRATWVNLARQFGLDSVVVEFEQFEPDIHARRRMSADSRGYTYEQWKSVAQRHHEEYEPVLKNEGYDSYELKEWND
jgi:predicted kinase